MPELPEVETVMRGLAKVLDGQVIRQAAVNREGLRWAFPAGLAQKLTGARVTGFRRRAKYMLMRLDGGDSVLIHLGMSGRMIITPEGVNTPPPKHEHLVMVTASGQRVGFVDPRRFGAVDLMRTAEEDQHKLLAGLGPEPLDEAFDARVLGEALAGKKTPIKAALLDQRIVAGLGNIYVSEALFRAEISPTRLAGAVSTAGVKRLAAAIKDVLNQAINHGGSTLRDYVQADGELGGFQDLFLVYDREGEPCPRCASKSAITRIVQAGRSTFFCARCQK